MNSGIYYLIARNISTNEKIQIELTNGTEDRYCTTLSYIDFLTSKFNDKNQLINQLYTNKYINFKNADIYIEYNYNGLKFEEVIYKNMALLTQLPFVSDSQFDRNNINFYNAANEFFVDLDKRNIRNYILNSPKINLKIKEHIDYYYKNQFTREGEFFKQKIIDDLTSYKTFRDLKSVIDEFNHIEDRKENEDRNNLRAEAKLVKYKQEDQLEFNINNNEIQLPNPNQVVSNEVLNQVIKEHNEEKEEFLTEDE